MTDKELIKKEIERRYNCEKCYPLDREANVAAAVLQELLLFIDSLPEEPASEDLTYAAYHYANNLHMKRQIQLFEEKDVATDFIAGAEWQKQKSMQDFLEKAEKYLVPHIKSILLGDMHDTSVFVKDFKNYMQDE